MFWQPAFAHVFGRQPEQMAGLFVDELQGMYGYLKSMSEG